ncbi:MAG: glycosyltransferase [Saprospiraceae bacterium]|nr:glycosyltransferase [Saprospiraceae bacterium]
MSLLSVIIPVLNESDNILKLIKFFNKQHGKFEIIVAESSSSKDKVKEICVENNFTYITCKGASRASQMNEAAHLAKGEILCFLHADVLPPDSFYNLIIDKISKGYCFGFFAYKFEPTSFFLKINAHFTTKDGIFSGGGDQIQFMTKSLYTTLNGYDPTFTIMEDFDFIRRFRKLNKPLVIIKHKAIVSSRKYKCNSWLRVNISNLVVFAMFLLRCKPDRIRKIYAKILH